MHLSDNTIGNGSLILDKSWTFTEDGCRSSNEDERWFWWYEVVWGSRQNFIWSCFQQKQNCTSSGEAERELS